MAPGFDRRRPCEPSSGSARSARRCGAGCASAGSAPRATSSDGSSPRGRRTTWARRSSSRRSRPRSSPDFDAIVAQRSTLLREGRDALVDGAARTSCRSGACRQVHGGVSLWIELDAALSSALVMDVRSRGVLLSAGPRFSVEGGHERHLRIPFTAPPDELSARSASSPSRGGACVRARRSRSSSSSSPWSELTARIGGSRSRRRPTRTRRDRGTRAMPRGSVERGSGAPASRRAPGGGRSRDRCRSITRQSAGAAGEPDGCSLGDDRRLDVVDVCDEGHGVLLSHSKIRATSDIRSSAPLICDSSPARDATAIHPQSRRSRVWRDGRARHSVRSVGARRALGHRRDPGTVPGEREDAT